MRAFLALVFLLSAVLLSLPADAKQKKPGVCNGGNGCSCDQVVAANGTTAGRECMRKLDADVISGVAAGHQFVCTTSGVYCCVVSGTQVKSCSKVSNMSVPGTTGTAAPPATLRAP